MIFLLTVILCCVWYFKSLSETLDSQDAKERPGGFDHKDAMGAGFGFMIALVFSVILGIILEMVFWKVIL